MPRPLRRFLTPFIWLVALVPLGAAVGYLLYANLLNPGVVERLAGGYDGLYWDAAQLQIAYARFENQLMLYGDGYERDIDTLRLRYQVLQSKLHVVEGSTSALSAMPVLQRRQQDDLRRIAAAIAPFDAQMNVLERDPAYARTLVRALRTHWDDVTDLSLGRRFADVTDRDVLRHDFLAKRRELFAAGIVLIVLSGAAAVLLVLNGYRRTRLIRQQNALLDAESAASRAAREAAAAKDAFLGMIGHELRTPLHAIVSSIELLGLHSQSESDRKVIRRLETAARQLEAQMKDLTDYARLGAGKLELRHERFDPRELLQSIVDQNEAAARVRGLAFESAASGAHGFVESDPHRIRQIANNLVSNAIRYTERGTVRVEFVIVANALSIVVSDTGPGVDAAQLPLIFNEFTQLDASRSRRYEGAGMGLAIVRGLVDLFGGRIDTDSRIGEGTTFTVTIPVEPVESVAAWSDAGAPPRIPDGMRPQVLVVDDNPLVRESLCEMVAHMGYGTLAAGDADTALMLVDTQRCDVVLLDLHMPGRDGYAFVASLDDPARHGARPHVIAVSASAPESSGADGAAADLHASGFVDYLTKPVHYDELRGALQRVWHASAAA